jgi:hypothetical protein
METMLEALKTGYEVIKKDPQWVTEIQLVIPEAGADPSHGYIDMYTVITMGRMTVWNSGRCELEAMNTETGDQIMREECNFSDSQRMLARLFEFSDFLGNYQPGQVKRFFSRLFHK